jgi:elongation factor Ts
VRVEALFQIRQIIFGRRIITINYMEEITMAISATMVKELREMTGAGMMDCKKALAATDGDMDKAVDFLREKGLAGAEKKAGRIAAEGIVVTALSEDEKKAVVVEVNAETDFVAKNEKFRAYAADVAAQALKTTAADMDAFMAEKWDKDTSLTVKEALSTQISIIGENMNIRRFEQVEIAEGFVASYIHAGGKIGVLVVVETDVVNDAVKEMAKNVAMQAAALKPQFTHRDEVSADYIEKEKEILTAAAKNEKPDANDKIISGMVMGRINKELKEICLLDQVYVKAEDGKQSVEQYVKAVAKENGANIKIKKFVRFETGEGLAKKEENFAEEVAKQMGM